MLVWITLNTSIMKQPVLAMSINYAHEIFNFLFRLVFILINFIVVSCFCCSKSWKLKSYSILSSLGKPAANKVCCLLFYVIHVKIKKSMTLSIPSIWLYHNSLKNLSFINIITYFSQIVSKVCYVYSISFSSFFLNGSNVKFDASLIILFF